ncbi:alpha/beta fold hydrolase [Erythrobacter rubeus]|uniref:Alpha/beta hydrolase n=1 Tax=Erythrobacter rubeus TaxID=2760803 RepID=A0ABR8KPI1_9SPHN|nr:alpha/beta hydrolase [Erythrobacter rubeus]MBD2842616.1 alpha/beta hydrolase [Erythrobacter rubeus]
MSIRRRYADCRDGQIHLREAGDPANPTICFFHQTASSGVMFEKVMARLDDRYHCISLDSPGFGQSYQPGEIPDMRFVADRLMEAIDDLGISTFHACGHHTGGCAAVEMPRAYPDRLESLTLIGPVLVNEEEKAEYRKTFVRPFEAEASGEFLMTAWKYLELIGAASSVDLHCREMADHLTARDTMPMAFSAVWNQDVEGAFRSVDIPLHIMCSKDDVLWPLFERAGEMRPDAKQSIVGGSDFQPDRDPEGVAKALGEFIEGLA